MLNLEHGRAYLALPKDEGAGIGVGVLLLHAWWGMNETFIGLADRLAAEGFVVLAPDMFGGQVASTIEGADALSSQADPERIIPQLEEALDHLTSLPEVTSAELGVIGFSFGAAWGLLMADRHPDAIGALVLFYGTYNNDWQDIRAAVQGHYAGNDAFEPREAVEALEKNLTDLKLDATFFTYEGMEHWFFEPDRPQYHAENARLAWERTVKFLQETLPPT